jgi:hypothetical protein
MFSTLRTRFGIPGVISVIALVFAMFGGAYAASNSSSGGKATASAKAKKGPKGPKGATGPAGAQGPAGPAGAKGDVGANGSNGAAGPTGPTGAAGAKGATGAAGATGATGFSGFSETLPAGKTETGTWNVFSVSSIPAGNTLPAGISFSIPLASSGVEESIWYLNEAETEAASHSSPGSGGCEGIVNGTPTAPPGELCVYTKHAARIGAVYLPENYASELFAYDTFGATLAAEASSGGSNVEGYGAWAVTAPSA